VQLELRTLRRNVPELEASCTTVRGEAAGYARQVSIWAARAVVAAAGMCVAVVAAAGMCVAFLTRGPYACALVRVCVCGRVRMHVSKSVCVYVFMCASCLCSSVCLCA